MPRRSLGPSSLECEALSVALVPKKVLADRTVHQTQRALVQEVVHEGHEAQFAFVQVLRTLSVLEPVPGRKDCLLFPMVLEALRVCTPCHHRWESPQCVFVWSQVLHQLTTLPHVLSTNSPSLLPGQHNPPSVWTQTTTNTCTLSSIFQCSERLINPARWACWAAAQQAHLPSPGLGSEHGGVEMLIAAFTSCILPCRARVRVESPTLPEHLAKRPCTRAFNRFWLLHKLFRIS